MAKITTQDCRAFLVSQVDSFIYPATRWAYDEGAGWDELANHLAEHYPDVDLDENDPNQAAQATAFQHQKEREVHAILSHGANWKRYRKEKGTGNIAWVRRFNCDTPHGDFDGQVAYEVLEDRNGTLSLGQYVGD
jgi:hypothetical protein